MVLEQLNVHPQPKEKREKKSIDTDFILFTKINSKWILDLYVKGKTIKILVGNIRENVGDLGFGNDFLDTILKAWSMKEKKNSKLDLIKLKTSSVLKKLQRIKRQVTN